MTVAEFKFDFSMMPGEFDMIYSIKLNLNIVNKQKMGVQRKMKHYKN